MDSVGEKLASNLIVTCLFVTTLLESQSSFLALLGRQALLGGSSRLVELLDEVAAAARLGLLVAEAELLELRRRLLADGLGAGQLGRLR